MKLENVCQLLEVYKDEIHDMHDTYAQQSFELFSVREELNVVKSQLQTKVDETDRLVTEALGLQREITACEKVNSFCSVCTHLSMRGAVVHYVIHHSI